MRHYTPHELARRLEDEASRLRNAEDLETLVNISDNIISVLVDISDIQAEAAGKKGNWDA